VQALHPGVAQTKMLDSTDVSPLGELDPRHPDGFFEDRLRIRKCRAYRFDVPAPGIYKERINTDSEQYGRLQRRRALRRDHRAAQAFARPAVLDRTGAAAAGHRVFPMEPLNFEETA